MSTVTYGVEGMTCAHCVNAVVEEVAQVPGVDDVQVALETQTVSVTSAVEVPVSQIRAAVEEAGYTLTGN